MQVFSPVEDDERDALLRQDFQHEELHCLERIAWDPLGLDNDDDGPWVTADVEEQVARRYEDPDGRYMGYRPFALPRDVVNRLSWRVVKPSEIAAARAEEAAALARASEQARAAALAEGRGSASSTSSAAPLRQTRNQTTTT